MATEVIPAAWFRKDKLDDVIEWLRFIPADPADKKLIFMQWAQAVGIEVTGEMIERLGAEEY